MKIRGHILLYSLLLFTSYLTAQVKFEAKVSKDKLGVNERLRIDFEMNKDGDNFVPPSFDGFTVVGGPNTSVSNSWINGKRTFSKTYSYFLAPKRVGKFIIKQALIEIDGETYKTFPVTVRVTKAVDQPKDGNNAAYVASQNIHLVAEVSKTNPYLNEAITVVYKLYVAPNTGVRNWQEKDTPRFNDFWSQNIDVKGLPVQKGKYKGEDYRYVVLRKVVLYPQKSGKLKIEPLSLDVTVEVPTSRRDFFGNRQMKFVPQTISAGSRIINVKPLPEEGKPDDFKGAVGKFVFKVTTTKKELDATASLQAKIEVSGKGNLKLFELPKLNLPSSLEVYEPEHLENVRTNLSGMQGKITDNYTIVPQYRGKYPIPEVTFSYFDLETESYKTLRSSEIVINVINGPVNNSKPSGNANKSLTPNKTNVEVSNGIFAFIKTKSEFSAIKPNRFFKSTLFWILLLIPLLLIPLIIFIINKREERKADVTGNRIRKADRLAKKYLSKAKKQLGQKEAFYVALEKALHNYLKAKLHIETSDFNKEKIGKLLSSRQVENDVINEFISILENCELARYTPITQVTMTQDYEKAAHSINQIDRQVR